MCDGLGLVGGYECVCVCECVSVCVCEEEVVEGEEVNRVKGFYTRSVGAQGDSLQCFFKVTK